MAGSRLAPEAYVRHLRADGDRFAVAVAAGLSAPVASCPGWTAAELAYHLGEVQYFWGEIVRRGCLTDDDAQAIEPPARVSDDRIVTWFREQCDALCTSLDGADPDVTCWSWSPEHRVGFVQRRMAQEAAVHRWDAEEAAGAPTPIDSVLAIDGIGEFVEYMGGFDPNLGGEETVSLMATDGPTWVLRATGGNLVPDAGEPDVVASGTASDLLLALWRRPVLERLSVTGDREALDRFLNRPTSPDQRLETCPQDTKPSERPGPWQRFRTLSVSRTTNLLNVAAWLSGPPARRGSAQSSSSPARGLRAG